MKPFEAPVARRAVFAIASAGALAVTLAIYLSRMDRVVGLIVDDAWYVLLAKALATGQGYTLINSPTSGITPFYPPGFPALLSIFYRLFPVFPDNTWLLKSVSIAAMIGAGFVAFHYFHRNRALPIAVAFAAAFATVLYPGLVFLATSSVMSECVFTLIQLVAIVVIEQSVRDAARGAGPSASRYAAAGGALASAAFLTRSAGLALLVGGVIYLLKERLLKQAAIFAAVAAIAVGPWLLYARAHEPTAEQRVEQGGSIILPYADQFWHRVAGRSLSGTIGLGDLPGRVWGNLNEIAKADAGAFVFYSFYRPVEPGESMQLSDRVVVVSLLFAFVALAGYFAAARERLSCAELVVPIALSICVLWGWEQIRLLAPLVPFFFLYLLIGVRAIARLARAGARVERVLLASVSGVLVIGALDGNYRYIARMYDPVLANRTLWIRAFDENEAFIRELGTRVPQNETIATDNPALVHLYTGHKTIASSNPAVRWRVWKHLGVRYYAKISPYPVELSTIENRLPVLYRSDGRLVLRLLDLGPPESREAWGAD